MPKQENHFWKPEDLFEITVETKSRITKYVDETIFVDYAEGQKATKAYQQFINGPLAGLATLIDWKKNHEEMRDLFLQGGVGKDIADEMAKVFGGAHTLMKIGFVTGSAEGGAMLGAIGGPLGGLLGGVVGFAASS